MKTTKGSPGDVDGDANDVGAGRTAAEGKGGDDEGGKEAEGGGSRDNDRFGDFGSFANGGEEDGSAE